MFPPERTSNERLFVGNITEAVLISLCRPFQETHDVGNRGILCMSSDLFTQDGMEVFTQKAAPTQCGDCPEQHSEKGRLYSVENRIRISQ